MEFYVAAQGRSRMAAAQCGDSAVPAVCHHLLCPCPPHGLSHQLQLRQVRQHYFFLRWGGVGVVAVNLKLRPVSSSLGSSLGQVVLHRVPAQKVQHRLTTD